MPARLHTLHHWPGAWITSGKARWNYNINYYDVVPHTKINSSDCSGSNKGRNDGVIGGYRPVVMGLLTLPDASILEETLEGEACRLLAGMVLSTD